MTSVFSATPPADQPPTSADVPPAAWEFAGRWDWLRIAAFFCMAVFLLSLIVATLNGWYYEMLRTNLYFELHQAQMGQIFFIGDLAVPATLVIAGSALSDRTFWGVAGRERLWGVGRTAMAIGVVAIVAGLALAFGTGIDRVSPYPGLALLPSGYEFSAILLPPHFSGPLDRLECLPSEERIRCGKRPSLKSRWRIPYAR